MADTEGPTETAGALPRDEAVAALVRAVDTLLAVMSDYGYMSARRLSAVEKDLRAAREALGLTMGDEDGPRAA